MALDDPNAPTFTVSAEPDKNLPPIRFTLTGVYAPGKHGPKGEDDKTWTEAFEALPIVPMAAAAALTEAFFVDDATGRRQQNPGAIVGFIRDALPDTEARRFMQLVHSKDKLMRIEVLADIVEYLSNRYTGRPTGAPSS